MKSNNPAKYAVFMFYPFYFAAADTVVWINSPRTPFFQFKAHVTALGKNHKTYAKSHFEYLKEQTKKFQLKDKIKKAQTAYLSGDSSQKSFLDIINLAYLGDWNEEQRRIILYAFLRLSQLENNSNRKKAFLISAGRFITEDISPDYPEYNLFPPPLIEEVNQLRDKQNSFLIEWKKVFPHYEILLVNGKEMPPQSRLNEGKYRVAALSSSQAPYIQVIDLSTLLSGSVKMELMTKGYCDSLKIKAQWRNKHTRLLKRKNCPKTYAFSQTLSKASKIPPPSNKRSNLPEKNNSILRADLLKESSYFSDSKIKEPEDKGFFNKKTLPKWIIIGGTLLTIGIVIFLNEPEKSSPERRVFY